jgi:hypothetical protein
MRDRRRYPRVQFLRQNAATRDEQELLAAKLMGLQHDKDPIADDHDGTCNMTIQHKPIKKTLHGLPRFTTVKGGAYVLLPGLRALRSLGNT